MKSEVLFSRRRAIALAGAACIAGWARPAYSAINVIAADRLLLASDLRMLGQRMTLASLFIKLDVEPLHFHDVIQKSFNTFKDDLVLLRQGSEARGLPPEDEPIVLETLDAVDRVWKALEPTYAAVVENRALDDAGFQVLAKHNNTLLVQCVQLASRLVEFHGDGNLSVALAVSIEVTGRLRVLSQKAIKEALLIAYGYREEQTRKSLEETSKLFDNSVLALLGELDGISLPPPSGDVVLKLRDISSHWADLSPVLEQIVETGQVDLLELYALSAESDILLEKVQAVLDIYQTEAHQLG